MSQRSPWIARPLAWLIIILPLHFAGCRTSPPSEITPMVNFSEYYAGELFLVEKNRLAGGDSLALRESLDSLRMRYDLTPGGRDSLLLFYRDSLPRWELFLTTVLRELEERERALRIVPAEPATGNAGRN